MNASVADPRVTPSRRQLEEENASLRAAIAAMNLTMWHQVQDRFAHGFDAIRNDCCPACGGPVEIVDVGRGLILEAARLP